MADMRLLPLLAAALVLAGCFGQAASPIDVVPYVELNDAAAGRTTEFAFYLRSLSVFKQVLPVRADAPAGWVVEPETPEVSVPGGAASSLVLRVTPDANATDGVHRVSLFVGDTRAEVLVNVRGLGNTSLAPGMGAQVFYVLFLDNGTLYATNLKAAWDRPGLERHGSNESDWTPLKVYVGGRRGEAPPEPYNTALCDEGEEPPCYHPVIPGFDARLRGMVAGETLTVRVPKEQAYTVRGNETHPLYGEDLNFVVRVVGVDNYGVRRCDLPVCPPPVASG